MEAQPIQALSRDLINKIAAGEVIGAPVNVIKELLENSIDACADQIEITIENGGYSLIKIRDDGTGIRKADMHKACVRHTTSKLSKFLELEKIGTFGFRGEALASMSRVAHVTITTKTFQEPCGYTADYQDEKMVSELTDTTMNEGTIIEVKDLFYNDPKRLSARGKVTTDVKNICDVITKYAVAYPQQSFILISNNKELLHTYGQSTSEDVLKLLFNIESAKSIFNLTTTPCVNVSANCFLSDPSFAAKKKVCGFFINGRLVSCQSLKNAIETAYTESVGTMSKPFYIIIIKMPQENIDVNVHPQKHVVKFLGETEISESLHDTIKEALDSRRHSRPVLSIREKTRAKRTTKSQPVNAGSQITQYLSQQQASNPTTTRVVAEPKVEEEEAQPLSQLDQARLLLGLPITSKASEPKKEKVKPEPEKEEKHSEPIKMHEEEPTTPVFSPPKFVDNFSNQIDDFPITGCVNIPDNDSDSVLPSPPRYVPEEREEVIVPSPAKEKETKEFISDNDDENDDELPKPEIQEEKEFIFSLPKVPKSVKKQAIQAELPRKTRSKSVQRSTIFEELKYAPKFKIAEDMGMKTLEQLLTPTTVIQRPERKVELDSILKMRSDILENEATTLTSIIKNSRFVGFVGLKNLILQSGDGLFLCNTYGLLKDFFVHKCLDLFLNYAEYRLPHAIDIEQAVNIIGKDGSAAAEVLKSNASLLEDYFAISIKDGKIYSMPSLVTGYKPSYSAMPLFLYNLATNVEWEDEYACLSYIIDQIASVSSPIPEDEADEEVCQRLKNEIMTLVVPAMNGNTYSATMDAGDAVVQLTTLASLYNDFNPL